MHTFQFSRSRSRALSLSHTNARTHARTDQQRAQCALHKQFRV
jgi:hypothetical protein